MSVVNCRLPAEISPVRSVEHVSGSNPDGISCEQGHGCQYIHLMLILIRGSTLKAAGLSVSDLGWGASGGGSSPEGEDGGRLAFAAAVALAASSAARHAAGAAGNRLSA